jgi:hypothetical protein
MESISQASFPLFSAPHLVAGKSHDYKLVAKFVDQLVHLLVIPTGCASEGSHILNHYGFVLEHVKIE